MASLDILIKLILICCQHQNVRLGSWKTFHIQTMKNSRYSPKKYYILQKKAASNRIPVRWEYVGNKNVDVTTFYDTSCFIFTFFRAEIYS